MAKRINFKHPHLIKLSAGATAFNRHGVEVAVDYIIAPPSSACDLVDFCDNKIKWTDGTTAKEITFTALQSLVDGTDNTTTYTVAADDTAAGVAGVPIGAQYQLAAGNTYTLEPGLIKTRLA